MPTFNCGNSAAALLAALVSPSALTNFFNPLFVEPTSPLSAFTIEIYVDGVAYNFSRQYRPKSMRIEDNFGFERGKCVFEIWDDDATSLPFIPRPEMKVEIWNQNKTGEPFFKGKIVQPVPTTIVRRDTIPLDYTEHKVIKITCTDLTFELSRKLIGENYEGFTSYAIVNDVVRRFTNLTPVIDVLKGITHDSFRVNQQTPAQVIQRILDIELDATVRIDPDTNEIFFGAKVDVTNVVLSLTDENYVNYFNPKTFQINTDSRALRNRVKFFYNKKYSVGKCNVAANSVTVFANLTGPPVNPPPLWTQHIKAPAEFRIPGATGNAVYTVNRVNSDTEITLTSEYKEGLQTNVDYVVGGSRGFVTVSDNTSIFAMAEILGETGQCAGLFEYMVPEDPNFYTEDEAIQICKAHLLRFSSAYLYQGKAQTTNMSPVYGQATGMDNIALRAGQTITMSLPVSRGIIGDIVIQQIVWKDTGATIVRSDFDPTDTRIDPLFKMDLDFTDRIFASRNALKRLQQDVRKLKVDDDDIISIDALINELLFIEDCMHVVEPIVVDVEELQISTTWNIRDGLPAGPFYVDAAGGHDPFVTLGYTSFSKTAP